MRTTLIIADDVWYTAKEMAQARNQTAGAVISELFRIGLAQSRPPEAVSGRDRDLADFGVQRFGSVDTVVTTADVNRIREDLGL